MSADQIFVLILVVGSLAIVSIAAVRSRRQHAAGAQGQASPDEGSARTGVGEPSQRPDN